MPVSAKAAGQRLPAAIPDEEPRRFVCMIRDGRALNLL